MANARALMRVRGMDTEESRAHVVRTLLAVTGVVSVTAADAEQLHVEYDPTELTVMDLIRAVRRIGFLAGME